MFRYLLLALFLCATVPLVPHFLSGDGALFLSGSGKRPVRDERARDDERETEGEKAFRIGRSRNGHYVLDVIINGQPVEMLVDTGASTVALPESVAEEAGIILQSSAYTVPVRTANGETSAAATRIDDLRIGPIRLRDVEAMVIRDQSLGTPLFGMSALNMLRRFDFSDDTLLLVQ